MSNSKKQELKIELPPELAQGKYVNLAVITHSHSEFFMDMICMVPNTPQAKVMSRLVMTPENAKQLMFALQENVRKYEAQFGEIKQRLPRNSGANDIIDLPFMGSNGEA